jgi:hypothetical protein
MVGLHGSVGLNLTVLLVALHASALAIGASTMSAPAQQPSVAAGPPPPLPTSATVVLSDAEVERFLKTAKITKTKTASKGITNSTQATMSDGTLTHDAHIQTIDEYKREFRSNMGVEFDFRDSWTFNIAAYKLDRLLGLNMVPVSVPGHYRSQRAAITWWVDNVMMDEGGRVKKKLSAPEEKSRYWSQQLHMLRVFDQLIYNTDRNLGNMLIDHDWRIWAIDHTRAFRKNTKLRTPAHVTRCDRLVFARLKALDRDTLKRELGDYLDDGQIKTMLARRDLIVAKLESLGPSALFDREPGT